MSNIQLFTEELRTNLKESYSKAYFIESLKHKKELTLEEAVRVLSLDEETLKEGIFSSAGGLVDKALEKVGSTLVSAKNSLVDWVSKNVLGGQVEKKDAAKSPFDGAQTLLPVAKMAKEDKEGFFQKVAKMTGNTAEAIKDLYMKLEGAYEKIPLVGKVAKLIPKGWRSVVIALIVAIVAGLIIYKLKSGQDAAPKAPAEAPKVADAVGTINPDLGEKASKLIDKLSGSDAHLKAYSDNPQGFVDKMLASFGKVGLKGDMDATKVIPGLKADTPLSLKDYIESRLGDAATRAGFMDAKGAASAGFGSLDQKIYGK